MKKNLLIFTIAVLLYLSIIFLVPLWGTQDKTQPAVQRVHVNILTYRGYTSLYLPANEGFNWMEVFPNDSDEKNYIVFTWKTNQQVKKYYGQIWLAPFGLAKGALSVSYSNSIPSSFFTSARYKIDKDSYAKMQHYILDSVVMENGMPVQNETRYVNNSYAKDYQVKNRPNLFYSGNTWLNGGLKAAGIKTAHWTLLPFGIFYHYNGRK